MKKKSRIPEDIIIEIGKDYSVKYKRTEYKYIHDKNLEWYTKSCIVNKKQTDTCCIIENDLEKSINYILSFAGDKFTITEI